MIANLKLNSASRLSTIRRARAGLTLIEVLLVSMVLLAVAAILASSLGNWSRVGRLDRAVDNVNGLLVGLRSRAMDENQAIIFAYTPGTAEYEIKKANADGSVSSDPALRAEFDDDKILASHKLDEGLKFETQSADFTQIRFEPNGKCDAHDFDIVEGNRKATFHVNPMTGAVTIDRPKSDR